MTRSSGQPGQGPWSEEEAARVAAKVTRRAIRRLDIFEWVVFAGALVVAILGGYGVAWLVAPQLGLDVRMTGIATALALFVVAGGIAIAQMRAAERTPTLGDTGHREEDDG